MDEIDLSAYDDPDFYKEEEASVIPVEKSILCKMLAVDFHKKDNYALEFILEAYGIFGEDNVKRIYDLYDKLENKPEEIKAFLEVIEVVSEEIGTEEDFEFNMDEED